MPAWSRASYHTLDKLLRSRVASTLIEAREISPDRVASAKGLLEADEIVWRARNACKYDHEQRHLRTVIEVLRSLDLVRDLSGIQDGVGRKALSEHIQADLARAKVGDADFPNVPGWSSVQSVGELWDIGRRLRICVQPGRWESANYVAGLITGRHRFLHHRECDLLAHLQHVARDVWAVEQVAGTGNNLPPESIRSALDHALIAGGLRLVPSNLHDALSEVLRPNSGRGLDLGLDLDDVEDDVAVAA